jgi:peptidoglycan/LPS O-acetylase OafA/YrhL
VIEQRDTRAPDATAPAGFRLGFRADIEGLRAIAILLVVAAHAGVPWLAGGYVGVDVFFVLSGYLITGLLVQEVQRRGRVRLGEFYARRLRRLLPALLTMIVGVGCVAALLIAPFEQLQQAESARAATLWLSNMWFALLKLEYFGAEVTTNLFLHTWSLGVEEQFYLVWPLLVMFMFGAWHWQGAKRDLRRLRLGMVATVLLCLPLSVFLTYAQASWGFYLMPSRAWQFALGALALLSTSTADASATPIRVPNASPQASRLLGLCGWVGIAFILAPAFLLDASARYPGVWATVPSLGAALVLLSGSVPSGSMLRRLQCSPPMQGVGKVSYAWYLWHWPVLLFGGVVLGSGRPVVQFALVGLSLLIAIASHALIEKPVRGSEFLVRRPLIAIGGSLALMAATIALAGLWQDKAMAWSQSPAQKRFVEVRSDLPVLYAMGCDEWFRSARVVSCGFGAENAANTVVIMGDSVMLQWFPAIAAIYDKPDWRLIVITKSSCPMVDESYVNGRIGREFLECEVWRRDALRTLASFKPDIVFLGSGLSYPFDEEQWVSGTRRVLDAIAPATGKVYLIRATHSLPFDGPGCLSGRAWRAPLPSASSECSAPAGSVRETNVYTWLGRAQAAYANVELLDLNALVCMDGRCNAERGGRIIYRDGTHLSAAFVATLADAIAGIMTNTGNGS